MLYTPAFRICGSIMKSRYSGVSNGTGAHCAGFQRHPKVTVGKPVVAKGRAGGPDCHDFGMRCWIIAQPRCICSSGEDFSIKGDNGADGHLIRKSGFAGKVKRAAHRFGHRKGHIVL